MENFIVAHIMENSIVEDTGGRLGRAHIMENSMEMAGRQAGRDGCIDAKLVAFFMCFLSHYLKVF